jgi:UDP-glucose 4-epimerase
MRNVLITGGAGFIGSHLAETLLQRGCAVQVIDDLSTGCEQNIAHLRQNPAFSFVRDTVIHREVTTELVARADMVFHLAAAVGVHLIIEQPVRTIETNIACTKIILELCAQRRTPVLLASTSEVYGKLQREKFREDDDLVLGPTSRSRWCYASSKIIDEFLAKAYYNEQGLPAVVARFFNTIGPRQTGRYGMVVPRFIDRALRGAPITVYGDGTQQRSFTWVGDVVDAILELMDKPSAMGEVFNIGHHEEVSIRDLARLIRDLTGSSSKIELVPYEKALGSGFEDIPRRLPDLTKIEDFIGYRPTRNLRAMLEEILTYRRRETHGVSKTSNVGPQDLTSGNIPSQW